MRYFILVVLALILVLAPAVAGSLDGIEGGDKVAVSAGADSTELDAALKAKAEAERQLAEARAELAKADADARRSAKAELHGDKRHATQYRQRAITRVVTIRQELGKDRFAQLMRSCGGPASGWAIEEVEKALKSGLLVGRSSGTTPASPEWQSPPTKQELATGLNRAVKQSKDYTDSAVGDHNTNPDAHPGLVGELREEIADASLLGKIAFWAIATLLFALLLLLLIAAMRRRNVPVTVIAGTPASGMAVPVVAGVATSAPATTVTPPAFVPNNAGVGNQIIMG